MNTHTRYRLKRQTIGVSEESHMIVEIPEGAEIILLERIDTSERNSRVTVEWEGQRIKIFAIDLKARGERVEGADA